MEKGKINEKKSLLKDAQRYENYDEAKGSEERRGYRRRERSEHKQERRTERRERHSEHHHESFFGRILTKILIILLLVIILLGAGYLAFTRMAAVKMETKNALIEKELTYCQELVTLKYRYTDVVALKKSVVLSKSYSIVKYGGIVRVGIADMSQCEYEASLDGKKLNIHLPEPQVLGNDITEQEVFDESHSIFVPITLEEVFAEIEKSRDESLQELLDEGILDEAKEQAQKIIKQMMLSAGFEEVEVD